MNFANTQVFEGVLDAVLETKQAILNKAVIVVPNGRDRLRANLAISQFRHEAEEYVNDPITFFAYPVFTSFKEGSEIGGILATNIYWKQLFADILPPDAEGYICVLKNSYNQSLTYRIDGSQAFYLGDEDHLDIRYDEQIVLTSSVNDFIAHNSNPTTQSYSAVMLSREIGKYTLSVYPSVETRESFSSSNPWFLVAIVTSVFFATSLLFLLFFWVVERRQRLVVDEVVATATRAATTERELNEFLAHECRNPLSAALTAHEFVSSSLSEYRNKQRIDDHELLKTLQSDVKTIGSSLGFVDEFLTTMLDMYRAEAKQTQVNLAQTDLWRDIFEPVLNMVSRRSDDVKISAQCPNKLLLMTDGLRLKQILLNLVRNASKFVASGFIRCRAEVVKDRLELSVEDSGPGIPDHCRPTLFQKYQTSLHVVGQGNGIGLSLCRNLATVLGARIYLDENYDSGVPGSPGARFTLQFDKELLISSGEGEEKLEEERFGGDKDTTNSTENCSSDEIEKPELLVVDESIFESKLSVLFVDDDKILRRLFSRAVQRVAPDWSISSAERGEEAITLIEEQKFDLIFMDMYMPSPGGEENLLGTETIVKLRQKGVSCTICGLSANSREKEFLEAGADAFLLKPIPCQVEELKSELQRIVSAGRTDRVIL